MTQKQPDEEIVDWQEEKIEESDPQPKRDKEESIQQPKTQQARRDFFNDY